MGASSLPAGQVKQIGLVWKLWRGSLFLRWCHLETPDAIFFFPSRKGRPVFRTQLNFRIRDWGQ